MRKLKLGCYISLGGVEGGEREAEWFKVDSSGLQAQLLLLLLACSLGLAALGRVQWCRRLLPVSV